MQLWGLLPWAVWSKDRSLVSRGNTKFCIRGKMWLSFGTSRFFQFPFGHSSRLCFQLQLFTAIFYPLSLPPPSNMNFVLMRSMIGIFCSRNLFSQSRTAVVRETTQVWRSQASCGDSQGFSPKPVLHAWDLVHPCISLVGWNQGIKWKGNRNDTNVTGPWSDSFSVLPGACSLPWLVLFVAKRWQPLGLGIPHCSF